MSTIERATSTVFGSLVHHRGVDRPQRRGAPMSTLAGRNATVDLSDSTTTAVRDLRSPPAQPAGGVGCDAPEPRERVGGRHPVGDARSAGRPQREHDAGLRGAVPLPAPAAARAPPAHGVRDVDPDRAGHRRVLPRAAPWRDPQPCSRPAVARSRSATARPGRSARSCSSGPGVLRRIAALIPDPGLSHLIPYNTTELERDIAVALGIPMYGADPRLVHLGTKTGCRRLFSEEGIRHPLGREDMHTLDDVADAVTSMRRQRSAMGDVIVKLNEGVSGQGNALVDLRGLPEPDDPRERAETVARLRRDAVRTPGHPARGLPRQARRARRDRRGAHRRRGDAQPERAAAGDAAG